jgi:hypothetical protein
MKYSSLYKILFESKEESEIVAIANRAGALSIMRDDTVMKGITVNIEKISDKGDKFIIHYGVLINGKEFKNNKKYFSVDKVTGEVYSGDSEEEINKLVPVNGSIEHAIAHTLKNVIQIGFF